MGEEDWVGSIFVEFVVAIFLGLVQACWLKDDVEFCIAIILIAMCHRVRSCSAIPRPIVCHRFGCDICQYVCATSAFCVEEACCVTRFFN